MEQRPAVAVFSNPDALSVSLIKLLFKNYCRVIVVSTRKKKWEEKIYQLIKEGPIEVVSQGVPQARVDYVVSINLRAGRGSNLFDKEKAKIIQVVRVAARDSAKSLFVFPFVQNLTDYKKLSRLTKKLLAKTKTKVAIIFLGQLIGRGVDLSERDPLFKIIRNVVDGNLVRLPKSETVFYPVPLADAAHQLIKSLFSFGFFGRRSAIISEGFAVDDLSKILKELKPGLVFKYNKKFRATKTASVDRKKIITTDIKKSLKETLDWFAKEQVGKSIAARFPKFQVREVWPGLSQERLRPPPKAMQLLAGEEADTNKNPTKVGDKARHRLVFRGFLLGAGLIILIPIISMIISLGSLAFAKQQLEGGNISVARKPLAISYASAKIFEAEALVLSNLPLVGKHLTLAVSLSKTLVKTSEVASQLDSVARTTFEFLDKILGDEIYDPTIYSDKIVLELDSLYKDLGFLQGEISNLGVNTPALLSSFMGVTSLSEVREKLQIARRIAEEAPDILGKEKSTTYLVLFQNNMELRPTGGFIGSFALVTFDKGRISDISVSDVYSADGQLKGHVEPPSPIKRYLGEAGWFLRDSNWDPDFATSAARAEWFLDKEIGVSVDGVIGVDLELARELLREVGPIIIPDFDRVIDSENLYLLTQEEVERDFFPGSRKKRNFLTALSRELLLQVSELGSDQYIAVSKAVLKNLEEKHVQIFIHKTTVQRALVAMGWEGGIVPGWQCLENCFFDWLGVVEANVGVNKANNFIRRSAVLETVFEKDAVKKNLKIVYANNAEDAPGKKNMYKVYIRVLAPQNVSFGPTEVSGGGDFEVIEPEVSQVRGHKEAGVLVEVLPKKAKSVTFYWEEKLDLAFNTEGEVRFYWRKQPGTLNDDIIVRFSFPRKFKIFAEPPFSLTEEESFGYNAKLSRDFISRIYWENSK